jgi:hypothetical protein
MRILVTARGKVGAAAVHALDAAGHEVTPWTAFRPSSRRRRPVRLGTCKPS